jgi:hypothetical protein
VNASGSSKQNSSPSSSLALIIARLALLFAIDTLAFWIIYNLFENGHYPLMAAFLLVTPGQLCHPLPGYLSSPLDADWPGANVFICYLPHRLHRFCCLY